MSVAAKPEEELSSEVRQKMVNDNRTAERVGLTILASVFAAAMSYWIQETINPDDVPSAGIDMSVGGATIALTSLFFWWAGRRTEKVTPVVAAPAQEAG